MKFTYFLLQLPPFVLLGIIILFFSVLGYAGTRLVRRFFKLTILRAHNEIVGYVFAVVGGFYGLLMGFVVFLVWDTMNTAQNNANREGSLARALYRDIRYFPEPARVQPLMNTYLKYVKVVVDTEFREMEQMKEPSQGGHNLFNEVFTQMEQLDAHEPKIEQMFNNLNELATYRSLRQMDASAEIPIEIWVPLLLGALIIMLFAMILDVESIRLHLFVTSLLSAFIGLVIYIILILDHPFTGKIKIEPTQYRVILKMSQPGSQ